MITGILITDGGAHSPEDWALATAAMLMQAFEVKEGPRSAQLEIAKDRARARVAEIMIEHHKTAQDVERKLLADGAHDRCFCELNAAEHVEIDRCIKDIRDALQPLLDIVQTKEVKKGVFGVNVDTMGFEDHLMKIVKERVEIDLCSVMDIERKWHLDRNPHLKG